MIEKRAVRPSDIGYKLDLPTYKVGDVITRSYSPIGRTYKYQVTSVEEVIDSVEETDFECTCGSHERAYDDGAYANEMNESCYCDDDDDYCDCDSDYEPAPMLSLDLKYCTCEDKPRYTSFQRIQAYDTSDLAEGIRYWDTWDILGDLRRYKAYTIDTVKLGVVYKVFTYAGFLDLVAVERNLFSDTVVFEYKTESGVVIHSSIHVGDIIGEAGSFDGTKRKGSV